MEQKSIWLNPQSLAGKSLREQVSTFDCELRKCEQLMVMGYNYSNHASLPERAKWLKGEIFRLEEEIKRLRDLSGKQKSR